jgi:hypothetical protein
MYLLFSSFIKNFYVLLLVCGFFKHFLGSSFGLWTWYCNNGYACLKVLSQDQKYEANTLYLIRESIYEAFIFLIIGTLLNLLVTKKIYLFFMMGAILHIMGEYLNIHIFFCKRICEKIN